MDELALCKYKDCNKIYRNPVRLTCCSKSICKHHAQDMLIGIGNSTIRCFFCDQVLDIPENGFPKNGFLEEYISSKAEDIIPTYITEFESNIQKYLTLLNVFNEYYDSITKIESHANHLKSLIDQKSEALKSEIQKKVADWVGFVPKKIDEETIELYSVVSSLNELMSDQREKIYSDIINKISDNIEELKRRIASVSRVSDMNVEFQKSSKGFSGDKFFETPLYDLDSLLTIDQLVENKRFEIISCSDDKTIKFWDLESRSSVRTILAHDNEIACVVVLSKSKIVSSAGDKKIKVWDLDKSDCIRIFNVSEECNQFLKIIRKDDKNFLAILRNTFNELNIISNNLGCVRGNHDSPITDIQINQEVVVSTSNDGIIKLWNCNTWNCFKVIEITYSEINCIKLASYLDEVIILYNKKSFRRYGLYSKDDNFLMDLEHNNGVMELLPCNKKLALGSIDNMILIWDLEKNECSGSLEGHEAPVTYLRSLSDNRLLSCSEDGSIKIWNISTLELEGSLTGHTKSVRFVDIFNF